MANKNKENRVHVRSIYLSRESLENMSKFQYTSYNYSYLYNYVTSPSLNVAINYLPKWFAPNILTLLSLLVHIIVITLILLEKGNNFSAPTSSYLSLLFTIAHFLYIILDNSDGKQARRTNSCTSLGLLLDHGIDAIVTSLMAIDIAHMMRIGNTMKSFIA